VIGFLRFIGVINAAIWLGGAVFFTLSAGPGVFSPDMARALGESDALFKYHAGLIAQVLITRYFRFHLTCALIAGLHLLAEWLYLGRPSRKIAGGLFATLLALTLVGGYVFQPRLTHLHQAIYSSTTRTEQDAARQSFGVWHGVSQLLNLLTIGGLTVYVWRTANPGNTARFISSVKFRG